MKTVETQTAIWRRHNNSRHIRVYARRIAAGCYVKVVSDTTSARRAGPPRVRHVCVYVSVGRYSLESLCRVSTMVRRALTIAYTMLYGCGGVSTFCRGSRSVASARMLCRTYQFRPTSRSMSQPSHSLPSNGVHNHDIRLVLDRLISRACRRRDDSGRLLMGAG
jgi:hypothetical protein